MALLIAGSAKIQMNFYVKAFHRGDNRQAKVALTFDDGPDKATTPEILAILDKHNIKAAFFVIGQKTVTNENILRQINHSGHLIGNHSWSHAFFFDFYPASKMIKELKATDEKISHLINIKPIFFRPPYGVTNPFLKRALRKTGHTIIGWSLKTFDTTLAKKNIMQRIEKRLQNGDIILLHDSNPGTAEILEELIELIKQKGIEIVRMDELLKINPLT